MSPMTTQRHPALRAFAAFAAVLIAAIALSTAAARPAAATPVTIGYDENVTFTWTGVNLVTDGGVTGQPDVGDRVLLSYSVYFAPSAPASMLSFEITGSSYDKSHTVGMTPGTTAHVAHIVTVTPGMLDALGSGPFFGDATFNYTLDGPFTLSFPLAAPPVLYTAPAPISVTTRLELNEVYAGVPDQLVEGDSVRYVMSVKNTGPVTLNVSNNNFLDGSNQSVAVGDTVDFTSGYRTVTYADMAAYGVTWPEAPVSWAGGSATGVVSVSVPTGPVESIDTSAASTFQAVLHDQVTMAPVALGRAQVGDRIDHYFSARNTGNVVANFALIRVTIPGVTGTVTNGTIDLRQGEALPKGGLGAGYLTSDGGSLPAHFLDASDLYLGYVDSLGEAALAPSTSLYWGDPAAYTSSRTVRTLLRDFTTDAILFVESYLDDSNGDGLGQAGENVRYSYALSNASDQDITLDGLSETAGSDMTLVDGTEIGAVAVRGGATPKMYNYTLTAADEARGTVNFGLTADFSGNADDGASSATASAPTIPTGTYVAPATTLETSVTYVDANGDGKANAGETATVTVTVTDTGTYALNGLAVHETYFSSVRGLLPPLPSSYAAGTSASVTFDYVLTATDEDNTYFYYAPTMAAHGMLSTPATPSAFLPVSRFQAPETWLTMSATYLDAMYDHALNPGETVNVSMSITNYGDYPLTGIVVTDVPGADITGMPAFPATLLPGESATRTFDYNVTFTDVARGSLFYNAQLQADGLDTPMSDAPARFTVKDYAAPDLNLVASATYDDANKDGFPSIGEIATFTVDLAVVGDYPLMGVSVSDGRASDIVGLLPAFPTAVNFGDHRSSTFDYVITAADYVRGSLHYEARLTAGGLDGEVTASASLTGITFQAHAGDLGGVPEGDISVCSADGTSTDALTLGEDFIVTPGACAFMGSAAGYRVVAFSSPTLLGTNTFLVTLPGSLGAGEHRIALYAPDGSLVGWRAVTVSSPDLLAATGFAGLPLGGAASALVLLGAAGILTGNRRRGLAG